MRYEVSVNKATIEKCRNPKPYVIVDVAGSKKETTKKKGLTPEWIEKLVFSDMPHVGSIHFRLMDHDRLSKDDFLGECVFDCSHLKAVNEHQSFYSGELQFKLDGSPVGTLTCVITAFNV